MHPDKHTPYRELPRFKRVGAPSTIRTCDLRLRRATLYPAELWVPIIAITVTALGCNAKSAKKFVTQLQSRDQRVDFLSGVVKPERRPAS